MDPGHFFASSRVLVVAGKGGVGKTVTAATIAAAASRCGLSVLLVEVAGRSAAAPMFGASTQGYEEAVLVHEAERNGIRHGEIRGKSITPDDALTEWLSSHGFNRLLKRMAKSGILEVVATATPGIKDLLVLGRIKALESEGAADLIVVDAPAAGHALGFLRSPTGVRDAARTGTIHRQAVEVLELISDPERLQLILVTIPEETPINELIETSYAVEDEVGVKLGPVVVNGVLPEIDGLEGSTTRAQASTHERTDLNEAAAFRASRTALQNEQLERLGTELPLPQIQISQVFGTQIGPAEIDVLAGEFIAGIEAL
ncbi:MAG: ArsA-related P-loop ATPase [Acidimicrobiales bacterium]|jgi:anion-transporting  ArsA/GET3 family ATPase